MARASSRFVSLVKGSSMEKLLVVNSWGIQGKPRHVAMDMVPSVALFKNRAEDLFRIVVQSSVNKFTNCHSLSIPYFTMADCDASGVERSCFIVE